jgi:hypothetical protein
LPAFGSTGNVIACLFRCKPQLRAAFVEKERLENKDFEDMALDRNVRVLWEAWSGTALCAIACSGYGHGGGGRACYKTLVYVF